LALTVGLIFHFHFFRGGVPGLTHRAGIIFFGFGVQWTLFATFGRMSAVRCLAKVRVILDCFLANVAHERPTGTTNLVAAITLDDGFFTFGAFTNHRFRNSFFHRQAPFGLYFSFDFVASAATNKTTHQVQTLNQNLQRDTFPSARQMHVP
jgi:hypothetical protein